MFLCFFICLKWTQALVIETFFCCCLLLLFINVKLYFRSCSGKGCQRRYHPSCVDPPLNYIPLGFWHCIWCTKKKMELGVHSVSKGVKSILDSREVVSKNKGMVYKITPPPPILLMSKPPILVYEIASGGQFSH